MILSTDYVILIINLYLTCDTVIFRERHEPTKQVKVEGLTILRKNRTSLFIVDQKI